MHQKLFHKNFSLVVIGQIISLFGNGIVRFALPLYLLYTTGSATLFGLVGALSFLPMIILTPIGGIIADRVNKRNIMVALDFLTAAVILIFFVLLGKINLVVLIIVTLMILFAIQGAYQPAVQASMPLLSAKENLMQANAIINLVSSLSGLLAPIIGGILYTAWGLTPILIAGCVCFFVSAVMEIFIHIPHNRVRDKQSIWRIVKQDFGDSLTFMRKEKPIILKAIWVICGFNLFMSCMMIVGMPVLITQTLGMSERLYGFSQGAMAAGGLFGGIMVGVLAKKLKVRNVYLLLLTSSIFLLPMGIALLIGLPPFISYLVISVCCFCLMSLASMSTIQLLTFLQRETPEHITGKVISCAMALSMCVQPIGQFMYGILFDVLATQQYYIIIAAAIASGLISLYSKRIFRELQ